MTLSLTGRPRRVEWSGPPVAAAATDVRRELGGVLVHWRLPQEVIDEAVVVVAELLANVVQHARTRFRLLVELRGRVLHVAVDDELSEPPPAAAGASAAGHIHGLQLVTRTAVRWGWQERTGGKTVWVELFV